MMLPRGVLRWSEAAKQAGGHEGLPVAQRLDALSSDVPPPTPSSAAIRNKNVGRPHHSSRARLEIFWG